MLYRFRWLSTADTRLFRAERRWKNPGVNADPLAVDEESVLFFGEIALAQAPNEFSTKSLLTPHPSLRDTFPLWGRQRCPQLYTDKGISIRLCDRRREAGCLPYKMRMFFCIERTRWDSIRLCVRRRAISCAQRKCPWGKSPLRLSIAKCEKKKKRENISVAVPICSLFLLIIWV